MSNTRKRTTTATAATATAAAPAAEAKTYSTNPHVKLRAGTNGEYSAAGTIVPGKKDYTMTVILDDVKAGDSFLGFPENDVSLAALGEKGAPISAEGADGKLTRIGWARPQVTPVKNRETGEKEDRVLVQVRIDRTAPVSGGKVIASITNHVMRRAQTAPAAQ